MSDLDFQKKKSLKNSSTFYTLLPPTLLPFTHFPMAVVELNLAVISFLSIRIPWQ